MKDNHNVILILASSSKIQFLIPEVHENSRFQVVHFSFRSSKLFRLYHFKAPSKSLQGFFSFFNCSSRFLSELRSAKLYSKINMVFNTCLFWGVQAFFILHSEVQFFLSYLLRWCYVILDYFLHVSWFTSCQEWDI